jgi:hypothetical protein
MVSEKIIKESFGKVKEDVEGIKNELAFALKRIAKIESTFFEDSLDSLKKNPKKRKTKK